MTQPNELITGTVEVVIEEAPIMTIVGKDAEILRFEPNGDIFVRGNKAASDIDVVEAFRDFIRESGINQYRDEIKRLMEENKRLKDDLSHTSTSLSFSRLDANRWREELEQVKAELDRLKTPITNYPSPEEIKDMLIYHAPTPVGKIVEHYTDLLQELGHIKAEREPIVTFAREVIQAALDGGHYDGGEIQALGAKLGMLEEVAYDPEKHGENLEFEPGDPYFVFTPILSQYKGDSAYDQP